MRAESFAPAKIRQFLSQYDRNLDLVASAYNQILNQHLPLRGPQGKIVGQLPLERRRSRLGKLHKTIRKLEMHPDDLVLALTLQDQTEALLDDVEDASQIAFDNDYEEAGLQLSHLQIPLGHDEQIIEEYTFQLARAAQVNLRKFRSDHQESGRVSSKIHSEN
ncbi:MAG: hypothetical protein P8Z30_05805 [Acidobacteriota bacterium]